MASHERTPNAESRIKNKLDKLADDIEDLPQPRKKKFRELLEKKAYSCQEAAILLGISLSTIRRLIAKGHIKSFRVGNLLRVSQEEVVRFGAGEDTINLLEAAKMLSVATVTIRRMMRTGKLEGFRVGMRGPWRISIKSIEDLMKGES